MSKLNIYLTNMGFRILQHLLQNHACATSPSWWALNWNAGLTAKLGKQRCSKTLLHKVLIYKFKDNIF